LGDPQPLPHPSRIAAYPPVGRGGQSGSREHLVNARSKLRSGEAVEPANELKQLTSNHPTIEPQILVQIAEAAAEVRLVEADLGPYNSRAARCRSCEARQDPDRRRLAGTIRTKQAKDRAAWN